jgi:hypothetical protein
MTKRHDVLELLRAGGSHGVTPGEPVLPLPLGQGKAPVHQMVETVADP